VNIDQLVRSIEREIEDANGRERQARAELDGIINGARGSGRQNLTADEDVRAEALFRDIDTARASRGRSEARLERAREAEDDERRIDRESRGVLDTGARPASRTASLSVGRNERTYRPDTDPRGTGFVSDVLRAQVNGDATAWQRLAAHMAEERAERGQYLERAAGDLLTSGIGGISVPQYLVDLTGEAAAARRPLADACQHHPLPDTGMTVTIPVFTTATSAALQATQLATVSGTSAAVTDLVMNVQTAAGFQQVSRQAVDRSRVDEFVLRDLIARYNTVLDSTLINQATTGLSAKAWVRWVLLRRRHRPPRCFTLRSLPLRAVLRRLFRVRQRIWWLCILGVGRGCLRK
jgi:hypothetical protein